MNWKTLTAGLLAIMTWMPLAASDPFYDARLKAGRAALHAQRPVDAVDQLRIAAFGLLDSPKNLSESLALLALAQSALGRTADVEATATRFVDVETRFASYDPATLDVEFRTPFESLLIRAVPKPTLAAVPSLARLVGATAPARRATTPVVAPQTPASRPAPPKTTQPQTTPAPPQTSSADPAPNSPPPARSREGSDVIDKAMQLLRDQRAPEAVDILKLAVSKEPDRRDLRLTLLQAGSMASNWAVANAQIALLRPFTESETVAMFYAAVALFETGKVREARELLDRSLPKIARSPYVDYYSKKIGG